MKAKNKLELQKTTDRLIKFLSWFFGIISVGMIIYGSYYYLIEYKSIFN